VYLSIYAKYAVGLLMSTVRCLLTQTIDLRHFVFNKSVVMSLRPSVALLFWVKGTTYHFCRVQSVYSLEKQWP